jgi:outer membrane protein OmpA-like peptidoglycan-associated protein
MQMDFLSAIPDVAKPMPPIGPGPDGTPPLPLINQPSPVPPRPVFPVFASEPAKNTETGEAMTDKPKDDVFESDPFFSQEPITPQPEPEPSPETDEPAAEPDGIPADADDASFDVYALEAPEPEPPPAPATAEERLLNSIVGDPDATQAETPASDSSAELAALQAELAEALARAKSAVAAHTQTRQDLQILKTRFSTLESDLAAARKETATALQMKVQTETRQADNERQWSDKLAQLRRMLDEVEDIRDEQLSKRVPKLLFVGTLVGGLVLTTFAYFLGMGHGSQEGNAQAGNPSTSAAPAASTQRDIPPVPPIDPIPPPASPLLPAKTPERSPIAETAVPVKPPDPALKPPVKPAAPATFVWPSIEASHLKSTRSGNEMKVVFDYGVFSKGVDLTSQAKRDLKSIASLKQKGTRFKIEVIGHTDPSQAGSGKSSAANNKALGLMRAKTVSRYLVTQCGWPADAITTSSEGEFNPPHPNTTADSQKKNRTVTLKITASSARSP